MLVLQQLKKKQQYVYAFVELDEFPQIIQFLLYCPQEQFFFVVAKRANFFLRTVLLLPTWPLFLVGVIHR